MRAYRLTALDLEIKPTVSSSLLIISSLSGLLSVGRPMVVVKR